MPKPLIKVLRGPLTESVHYGHIAVVDHTGRLIASWGDPHITTYMRSAAKPIQALEVILSGAADRYAFSDSQLAVMCASHYGEPQHLDTVTSILKTIGLDASTLQCGAVMPLKPAYCLELARRQVSPSPLLNDCSGKHAGMLAVCRHCGLDIQAYLDPEHPLQQRIIGHMARVCGMSRSDIAVGIDGCSAPVFGLPLFNMAQGYARLAHPDVLPTHYPSAIGRIFSSMTANPFLISGTNGFDTALIRHGRGDIIGKIGAEGIYCVAVRSKGLGIAIKASDGSDRPLAPTTLSVLRQLGIVRNPLGLEAFVQPAVTNDKNQTVGSVQPVVDLDLPA